MPIHQIGGENLNVGSNDENYKIIEVGEMIKELVPETEMVIDESQTDNRNYNVSFDKIKSILDYSTDNTIRDGIIEIKEAMEKGEFEDYYHDKYNNYKFLKNKKIFNENGFKTWL